MFLDNLSAAVQLICKARKLSYASAAGQCGLSVRCFGDIARGKAVPSILTLEKLCSGFKLTPNDLLVPQDDWGELGFRMPMPVTHVRRFNNYYPVGTTCFPICPRCGTTMEREYQAYCDRCGQCLSWKGFSKATAVQREK